jgi:hypothetical protein
MTHAALEKTRALRIWTPAQSALVVAGVLLLLSELLVPGAPRPFPGHGERFAAMAQDPFTFEGPFPQRLLWPVGAWCFSHIGMSALTFSHLCTGALLAVVFWFSHRRTGSTVDATLLTTAAAASGAALVYNTMACYADQLSLASMFLLVHFAGRRWVFWSLVLVSSLAHELVFFFWPWLLYLRCRNGGVWWRDGLCLVAAMAAYLLFRSQVTASYGTSYYLENAFWFPWCMPVMWTLWAFEVLVEFGPLLALVAWGLGRGGALSARDALGGRLGPLLFLCGVLSLMVLAYDVMRFATFAVVPVVLAGIGLVQRRGGRVAVATLIAAAVLSYAWLHPVASEQGGRHFTDIASHIRSLLPTRVEPKQPMAPEHAWTFTAALLERWWWPVGGVALAGALGVFAVGRALRRLGAPAANVA